MLNLADHISHFRARVLQDALTEATAAYFERRARQFEEAAPRPGEFSGRATRAELADRAARCLEVARACRQHAALLRGLRSESISDDVRQVLDPPAPLPRRGGRRSDP